jgi:hypothetical protein
MVKYTHWAKLWWAILQQFGKECYRTWVSEVLSTFVGGVAGGLTDYFRSHGHSSFVDALFNGSVGAAIVFCLYAVVNLVRSVWLEHKNESVGTVKQGIGGVFVVLFLVCAFGSGAVLAFMSFRSDIKTLSASADPGAKDAEITQLKARQCSPKQGERWTKQGIKYSYLHQNVRSVSDPSLLAYSLYITYLGSATFNPIRLKIEFNQPLEGKLAKNTPGRMSGDDGVWAKAMPRGDNTQLYSALHFCGDDFKIDLKSNVLILECSQGQMNAPDDFLVTIQPSKPLSTPLAVKSVQRPEKD